MKTGKTSRRDLLKVGAAGTAAAGLGLVAGPGVGEAATWGVKVVNIHGTVFNPDPTLGEVKISITVEGPRDDLSGDAWDFVPAAADPASGACYYTQEGSANSETVELSGIVLFSGTPGFLNAPVTTVANFKTGEITWTFAGFVFTGTGTVVQR